MIERDFVGYGRHLPVVGAQAGQDELPFRAVLEVLQAGAQRPSQSDLGSAAGDGV